MCVVSKNSSMPAKPSSQPNFDCLRPSNEAAGFAITPLLIATTPDTKDFVTFIIRFKSMKYTHAIKENFFTLVSSTDSSCKFVVKITYDNQLIANNRIPRTPTRAHLPLLHSCPGGVRHVNAARGI